MAKTRRKQAKVDVGLAHVEAALEMVAQTLEDIRLVVAEMREQEAAGERLVVPVTPGVLCRPKWPGEPCQGWAGQPCAVGPGKPCIRGQGPGRPCRNTPGSPCQKPMRRRTRR